jgi:hypothetical protein
MVGNTESGKGDPAINALRVVFGFALDHSVMRLEASL